jgi:hypothetical protein|tara:strand:- start:202 stop:1023 length:822 start_codon:yes stop_codon:yes gene_type:complete
MEEHEYIDEIMMTYIRAEHELTLIYTYYGQIEKLIEHCKFFSELPYDLKNKINVVFVNDAFNDKGAFEDIIDAYKPGFKVSGYKVLQDLGFNNHGCRNLAMLNSTTHWNLLLDIDCFMTVDTLRSVLKTPLEEHKFYVFRVHFDHTDNPEDYDLFDPKKLLKHVCHPNIWLISKPCFWSSGGYDIEFAGCRHGDKEFWLSIDKDKYDHFLWEPNGEFHSIHVRSPNRSKSYLNQAHEKASGLKSTMDFVVERNDNRDRKLKKRLICFEWKRVA